MARCFDELNGVCNVYCSRTATLQRRVWDSQQALVSMMMSSLRTHIQQNRELGEEVARLRAKDIKLTRQTKRSLGILNSQVEMLETKLIQKDIDTNMAQKSQHAAESELNAFKTMMIAQSNTTTDYEELSKELNDTMNSVETELHKQELKLAELNGVYNHFEMIVLQTALNRKRIVVKDVGVQTAAKQRRQIVEEIIEPAPIPVVRPESGLHIPLLLRRLMAKHPQSHRVMSKKAMERLIIHIYIDKIREDKAQMRASGRVLSMSEHVYSYLTEKYGLQSLTDPHVAELIESLRYYKEGSERSLRFGHFLGCFNKPDELPEYDIRVDGFVLHVLENLKEQHAKKSVEAGFIETTGRVIIDLAQIVAEVLFPLGNQDVINMMYDRITTLKCVSADDEQEDKVLVDDFLAIMIDTWVALDKIWVDKLRRLYHDNAKFYYKVNGYMIETTKDAVARPDAEFVSIVSFNDFLMILEESDPNLPDSKAKMIFDQGVAFLHKSQLEHHESKWQQYHDPETGKNFFYSKETNESSWERPKLETFEVGEITLPAFLHVAKAYRLGKPPHKWENYCP